MGHAFSSRRPPVNKGVESPQKSILDSMQTHLGLEPTTTISDPLPAVNQLLEQVLLTMLCSGAAARLPTLGLEPLELCGHGPAPVCVPASEHAVLS